MALFASLCLLILTLPIAYPIAQAHAESAPNGIICSQADWAGGDVHVDGSDHLPVDGPDDCPCATACSLQQIFQKLAPVNGPAFVSGHKDVGAVLPTRAAEGSADTLICHRPPGQAPPLSI
jgi:hypothetical protein